MDEEKRKPIMIGVIVVCLIGACVVLFNTLSGGEGGINSIPEGEATWVKCNNPACNAEYQMSKREYFKELQKANPTAMSQPALVCKECGKKSLYRAVKCENCGKVFFWHASGANDFADRCPHCKYSAEENKRINRSQGTNN